MPSDTLGQIMALVRNVFSGWPLALSLLGILAAHEFGHYLMSRHHKTPATLPFFIPLPFSPLGTRERPSEPIAIQTRNAAFIESSLRL